VDDRSDIGDVRSTTRRAARRRWAGDYDPNGHPGQARAAGAAAVPTLVLTWIARVEPDRLEPAGSLTTGMFQVAIALGAAVGGALLDAFDVRVALIVAGVAAAIGGVLFVSARRV
jgi:predicted MFS family arabinose efflux permease